MSSFGQFYFDVILNCYRRLVVAGVGLRKSWWQKAPSCRPEIMLGRAGLGVLGIKGEFQGKCQFRGVCRNLLKKNRNIGQNYVRGMKYQFEPGISLRKIGINCQAGKMDTGKCWIELADLFIFLKIRWISFGYCMIGEGKDIIGQIIKLGNLVTHSQL